MRDNIEFRTKQWRTELSISVVCNDRRFGYPPSMLSIWLDIRFLFSLRNKWRLSDLLLGKSPNCHQFRIILGEFLAFLHPFLLNYIITHNILILDVIEAIFLWNDVAISLAHAIKIEKKPEWCIFLQCACKSWAVRQIYIFFLDAVQLLLNYVTFRCGWVTVRVFRYFFFASIRSWNSHELCKYSIYMYMNITQPPVQSTEKSPYKSAKMLVQNERRTIYFCIIHAYIVFRNPNVWISYY